MASDDLNEQSLQFKKRARRRLVGALALVLLMMIVLPLVLNDRSNAIPAQEIAINIPSQEQNTNNTAVNSEAKQAEAEPVNAEQSGEDFNSKIVPVTEPTATSIPDEKNIAEQRVTEAKAKEAITKSNDDKLTNKQEKTKQTDSKTQAKIAAKESAINKEEAAKVPAKKDDRKSESVEVQKSASYAVQIGVFSDADNVKKLSQKLSGIGFKSSTEKIETPKGEKIRLRTGPFASKDEAESALAKMKGVGLAGMIVTL